MIATNSRPQNYKFTGKERDAETGLDNFGARYDASNYGRFMSPDPLGGHLEDPQTLNRYSYVRNNPLSLTDQTGLDFALDCSMNNGTTCQSGHVYYKDQNGKYQETKVSSDKKGNLTDQQGNKYSGTFNGKAVTFSDSHGNKSTGDWIQGSNKTSGITGGGALSDKFNFTFQDHGAHQTLNAFFTYRGPMQDAFHELSNAGFVHWNTGGDVGYSEWRSPTSERDSSHFQVWDPNWIESKILTPPSTVPGTQGRVHSGEYYSGLKHEVCDVMGLC
jgi:RHS repeat-associated protein